MINPNNIQLQIQSSGLYRFNYLQFGIAITPAIFQSFLRRVLSGIDNIIKYQDDILVICRLLLQMNSMLF